MSMPPRTARLAWEWTAQHSRVLVLFGCLGAATYGQQPVPVADRVEQPLLPSGISDFPVKLNGELVYVFKDEDGTDALHFIGDFVLTVGEREVQELRSKEAVVWIENRRYEQRPYRRLQILLWRDAAVDELGGTLTSGPALFVTLNTFAEITTHADDVAMQSSAETQVYREGNTIRQAFASGKLPGKDEEVSLRVFDPSGLGAKPAKPAPKPIIHFQSRGELTMSKAEDGRQVITMVGGVYLARGVPGTGEYLELQADSVVIFLPPGKTLPTAAESGRAGLGGEPVRDAAATKDRADASDRQLMSTGLGDVEVESAYLEGDVQVSQGLNAIRASRLYYDFLQDRALILDAVVRTMLVERNIPIIVRAAEIRQLSANEFSASDAILTTSEFHTPHYHIGARRVDLVNRTPAEPGDGQAGIRAGNFRIKGASLNVGGHPMAYWPFIRGDVDTSETAIQSMRTGYSDDFGFELEAKWHLFNLLGLETPKGFHATFATEYFSERGPAIGIDADYERDRYFGTLKSYLLSDDGEDDLGNEREDIPAPDVRGRLLLRHRQYLEDDWQISLELSYLSDRNFLEEFFEPEFDTGKEQETLLYLKKQRDNWAFTAAYQARILDFYTQTERLPDFSLHLAGESLANEATWISENRAGIVRYRAAEQTFREFLQDGPNDSSGSTFRADTRQEVGLPVDAGVWRFVPFAAGRGTAWDDSPDDGGLQRGFGIAGVRGSMYLTQTYPDMRYPLIDVDGVRHIIKPKITAWTSESNLDKDDLYLFDETVEGIDATDGVTVGIRQRFQTKRGAGANRRTVDVLTHDLEVGVFNDAGGDEITNGFTSYSRPENSITRNFINSSTVWRFNDRTALLTESNYDLSDAQIDILNVSVAVERTPRFSYLVGYRFIEKTESNLLGFDMNYRLTEKHTFAARELFDLDQGRTLEFTIAFIRKFPRWYGAISFDLDNARDDFGVSVSLWPEGLSQAALGSRRFTGLASSTSLRND